MSELKPRLQDATVQLIMLTQLGAAIHVVFFVFANWQISSSLFLNGQDPTTVQNVLTPLLMIIYFILTIAYSIATSLSIAPKRIVSPFNIQIGTASFLSVALAVIFLQAPLVTDFQQIQNLIFNLLGMGAILVYAGFMQTQIVKWVIGLNGTEDDIERATYLINSDYNTVAEILKDEAFSNLARFRVAKEAKDLLVLEGSARIRNKVQKFVVALGTDFTNKGNSLLTTASYEAHYYTIAQSRTATERRKAIVRYLEGSLRERNPTVNIIQQEQHDKVVTPLALAHALALDTKPRLVALRRLPKLHVAIMGGIAAAVIAFTILFNAKLIEEDTYYSVLIIIIITVFVELIPLIREGFRKT